MRFSFIAMLLTAISFGIGVFIMANHVQQAEKRIDHLQAKIETEKENLRVLHAEWTFLNSPERLEKVARQHFHMVPS
jgi:cell division protein FtsL